MVFTSGRGYEPGDNVTTGLTAIAVVDTDGGDQRDLTAAHSDRSPAWSPDGGSIAFLRQGRRERVLMRMGDGSPIGRPQDDNPACDP